MPRMGALGKSYVHTAVVWLPAVLPTCPGPPELRVSLALESTGIAPFRPRTHAR